MASLEYFLVAESCSVDQVTNRVSLFHVFEDAYVPKLPAMIPQVVVASAWLKDAGEDESEFQLKLTVESPGIKEPQEFKTNFQFGQNDRVRIQQTLINLKIQETGVILFNISLDGHHQASHRLIILKAPENEKSGNGDV